MKTVYNSRYDLAHAFFYTEYDGLERRSSSVSFRDGVFYSYYTTIGYIARPKNGAPVLLASDSNMTHTTSKHIGALVSASPYDVLYVPFKYGERLNSSNTEEAQAENLARIAALFVHNIDYEMTQKRTYTRKPDRDAAEHLLNIAEKFSARLGVKIANLAKYRAYIKKALNADNIKKAAARARQAAAKKAKETARRVAAFKKRLASVPMLENINKYIFDFKYYDATPEEREEQALFKASFGVDSPSFVTVDASAGLVRTSQHVSEKIADILPLLRMWKHKHNIIGLRLGAWTVLANNDKYVKIGCHNIPVANVQALAETLL